MRGVQSTVIPPSELITSSGLLNRLGLVDHTLIVSGIKGTAIVLVGDPLDTFKVGILLVGATVVAMVH